MSVEGELLMKTIILSLIASLSASAALAGASYGTITPAVDNGGSNGAGVVLVLLTIGVMMILGNSAPQQRAKSPEVEADDDDVIMKF